MKFNKKIIFYFFILTVILLLLLIIYNNYIIKEGYEEYPDDIYHNTKTDCNVFCRKLVAKGNLNRCKYFNTNKNIKCLNSNKILTSPVCEYIEKKEECVFNESYNPTINDIIEKKPPWGIYDAAEWDSNTKTLRESRGNGRNVISSGEIKSGRKSGYGAIYDLPFIGGNINSSLFWSEGSIPKKFTICSITRYSGRINKRILTSSTNNWLHGHWGNKKGVAFYEGWKTNYNNSNAQGSINDWLVMCGKNGEGLKENIKYENKTNNIIADDRNIGMEYKGEGGKNYKLSINGSPFGENSDWELSYVIIWDQLLTDNELKIVSRGMMKKKRNNKW